MCLWALRDLETTAQPPFFLGTPDGLLLWFRILGSRLNSLGVKIARPWVAWWPLPRMEKKYSCCQQQQRPLPHPPAPQPLLAPGLGANTGLSP